MQSELPTIICPRSLAAERAGLAGDLPLASMNRLASLLDSAAGAVQIELQGNVDDEGIHYLQGRLYTVPQVVCQRCLQGMPLALDVDICLGIVRSEQLAKRLPEHYEPLVLAEDEMALSDLIEDELILAMPFAPCCEYPDHCEQRPVIENQAPEKSPNPFADLADLLKQSQTKE